MVTEKKEVSFAERINQYIDKKAEVLAYNMLVYPGGNTLKDADFGFLFPTIDDFVLATSEYDSIVQIKDENKRAIVKKIRSAIVDVLNKHWKTDSYSSIITNEGEISSIFSRILSECNKKLIKKLSYTKKTD